MSRTSRSRKGRMIDPIPETHLSPPNFCRIFAWFLAFGGPAPMIGLVQCTDQDLTPSQRNSPQTFIPFLIRIKKKRESTCSTRTAASPRYLPTFSLHDSPWISPDLARFYWLLPTTPEEIRSQRVG